MGREDVRLLCYFREVREIKKSGVGRLDVCTIGYADSDAGGNWTPVSARPVDHEIITGASGVGDG
jgi:hypothetical protein